MSFIKLDRKLLKWEWKDDPNMVALWIEILLQANYCDSTWHGQPYERGSFPTSIEKLSVATGLSKRQTRTCLEKLKSTHEVTIQATNHGSKIIVNKWADYQCCDDDSDTQVDTQNANNRHAIDTQVDNTIRNKEGKKEKNTINISSLYAPSSRENEAVARIPLNINDTYYLIFQEDIDHYKELYPAVDVEQEIRAMVGWCEANPSNRKTKGGVKRFIANWLNKSQNRARAYSQPSKGDSIFYDTN